MVKNLRHYIEKNNLFDITDSFVLAVSGGVDSMVMAHLFSMLNVPYVIAHCNFSLRGEESDMDAAFVKKQSKEVYGRKCFYKKFDTEGYASKHKINIQQAARELRYKWFKELRQQQGINYIATAHHADDDIETFFINLFRGSGITGLTGIPKKQSHIIRPLLFATRQEIEKYAIKNNLSFRTDSTNQTDKYLRNKIRHHLTPLLHDISPSYRESITQSMDLLKATDSNLQQFISQSDIITQQDEKTLKIDIHKLGQFHAASSLLFEIISRYGFNAADCEDIIHSIHDISGKKFNSKSHILIKDRKYFFIQKIEKSNTITNGCVIFESTTTIEQPIPLSFEIEPYHSDFLQYASESIAQFDFDKLQFPLTLRKWKRGDYFYPLGMKGKKKLSDFFSDKKMSLFNKAETWLLCSAEKVVWVVGHRIDNRYKVNKHTKKIYKVEKK